MKRVLLVVPLVAGFALAGTFSAAVIAETTTTTPAATVPASTNPAPTPTLPAQTVTTPPVTVAPSAPGLPRGVRIAGVRVGGLERQDAAAAVQKAFARPLRVTVDGHVYKLRPAAYATPYTATAVARARVATPATNVRLAISVRGAAVRAWAAGIARGRASRPVDARLSFHGDKPVLRRERPGRSLDARSLAAKVISALQRNTRLPIGVRSKTVPAKVTAASLGPVIVIDRGRNRLSLYGGGTAVRTFPVATGQAIYPTPSGTFHIVVKQRDPWWYPPTYDSWAAGLKPVPPGPDNPLGTRWMGLSVPGVGIHGTDEPASIGYSESHGCIRMQVPDAEWLFEHVKVGTTVHIV